MLEENQTQNFAQPYIDSQQYQQVVPQSQPASTVSKSKLPGRKVLFIGLGIFVLLALISTGMFFFSPWGRATFAQKDMGQDTGKKETLSVLEQVGKLMDLPKNEEPMVATIKDKDILTADQKFFEGAQNGDILIIYSQAAKAIIYSPARNMIVNVGPLVNSQAGNIGNSPSPTPTVVSQNALKIEMRNGTEQGGLANNLGQTLSVNQLFKITAVTEAAKKDYANTIIVDTGKNTNNTAVGQLSGVLGATTVKELPEGEKPSTADIIVIVGNDKIKQ